MRKMVTPAGPNVLAELDRRPATAFYWRLTLLSTLGGFAVIAAGGLALLSGMTRIVVTTIGLNLPETKGHSVEEIIGLFEREARGEKPSGGGSADGGRPVGEGASA